MTLKTKIAVVDNHHLVRYAVSKFISDHSDRFEVSLECTNGIELATALRAVATQGLPKIVLTDLSMPGMDGYELTRWIKSNYPDIKILVLTLSPDDSTIIRLIKAGISGYLFKNIDGDELFEALATVDDGGTYFKTFDASIHFPSEVTNKVEETWYNLTERERQFVRLCTSDLEDREVLAKIGFRPNTTEPFVKKIYTKFGVKTRVGLVMLVTKHKLLQRDDLS